MYILGLGNAIIDLYFRKIRRWCADYEKIGDVEEG